MSTEQKRRQWLKEQMGYTDDEIELILEFDGYFVDGTYND